MNRNLELRPGNSIKRQTPLYDRHLLLGADMVEFGGWDMPIKYPPGIIEEHLTTRETAGIFDISHMGRFRFRGTGVVDFLRCVLTNDPGRLRPEDIGAQYTIIPTETGGAIDDAYLYRFKSEEYLLVVNASNQEKDWRYLQKHLDGFTGVEMTDLTENIGMLALQGPRSEGILSGIIDVGKLPLSKRNTVGIVTIQETEVMVSRSGYTGEPVCFELFIENEKLPMIWDLLIEKGALPIGLGARDTLRLEAGLPLYGHEMGLDVEGREIPILANPRTRIAVDFSVSKGDFIGRPALMRQYRALQCIMAGDTTWLNDLPRLIQPVTITGRGIARAGQSIFSRDKQVGVVTSGTRVPYWWNEHQGSNEVFTPCRRFRSICLGYMDADIFEENRISIDIRGKEVDAKIGLEGKGVRY